jgi:hypothetical protein
MGEHNIPLPPGEGQGEGVRAIFTNHENSIISAYLTVLAAAAIIQGYCFLVSIPLRLAFNT